MAGKKFSKVLSLLKLEENTWSSALMAVGEFSALALLPLQFSPTTIKWLFVFYLLQTSQMS